MFKFLKSEDNKSIVIGVALIILVIIASIYIISIIDTNQSPFLVKSITELTVGEMLLIVIFYGLLYKK